MQQLGVVPPSFNLMSEKFPQISGFSRIPMSEPIRYYSFEIDAHYQFNTSGRGTNTPDGKFKGEAGDAD
jgi:hypothetical protein